MHAFNLNDIHCPVPLSCNSYECNCIMCVRACVPACIRTRKCVHECMSSSAPSPKCFFVRCIAVNKEKAGE